MHCRFKSTMEHSNNSSTTFLALDKPDHNRQYLEVDPPVVVVIEDRLYKLRPPILANLKY